MLTKRKEALLAAILALSTIFAAAPAAAEAATEAPAAQDTAPEQPTDGAEVAERESYAAIGGGLGLFLYLPALRAFVRRAHHDISFEARLSLFIPSFVTGDFLYEFAAGPRFHVLQWEDAVGFVAPRVGFWDIGPMTDEDEAIEGSSKPVLNPMLTAAIGADFFFGSLVLTPEIGGGIVWGQRFRNMDSPTVPLVEINVHAGWVF